MDHNRLGGFLQLIREGRAATERVRIVGHGCQLADRLDRGVLYWGVSRGRSRDAFLYGRREVATSSRE